MLLLLNLREEGTCIGSGPKTLSGCLVMPREIKGHVSINPEAGRALQ